MKQPRKVDFTRLLGFESVSDQISGGIDFQDETIAARLGAKVSIEPPGPATLPPVSAEGD